MKTLEYLADPTLREIYLPAIIAGLAIVAMCGVLAPFVVLKRLAFVGQGVSHSAFGGLGLAAVFAALVPAFGGAGSQFALVVAFCLLAAWGMAAASDRRTIGFDTAIGLFLVASMAAGAVLLQLAQHLARARGVALSVQSWDAILFGSIFGLGPADAWIACGVAASILLLMALLRRPLLFWAFDENSAPAFGVPGSLMKIGLLLLLALAVVTAMKLAGVILATALLVLPGAAALKLSDRLGVVMLLSLGTAAIGLFAGLVASFEFDTPPGASIVLVMTTLFVLAWGVSWARRPRTA